MCDALIDAKILPLDARSDVDHIGLGLFKLHARLEAADKIEVGISSTRLLLVFSQRERRPQFDCVGERGVRQWKSQARGHHADHRVRRFIQLHHPPDDVRIGAEMSSPEPFAKRDDAVLPDYVFLSRESAPEQWRHAEQWKEA